MHRRIFVGYGRYVAPLVVGSAAAAILVGTPNQDRNYESVVQPAKGEAEFTRHGVQEARRRADEIVRRFKEERGVPGISVGVSVNGVVVWKTGYGYADVENLTPCTGESVMRIASISKSLTMTLVAKLIQENLLDLDAPVQKYVPSFPEKEVEGDKVSITTRHLVSHLSGIRHYEKPKNCNATTTAAGVDQKAANVGETAVTTQKALCEKCQQSLNEEAQQRQPVSEFQLEEYYSQKQYNSITEALSMFKDDPLLSKPGTKFTYTTHGWTLVSAVVEGASGKKFTDLFKELFAFFDMRHTYLDENSLLIPNRAKYYRRSGKSYRLENVPSVNNSYKWAGGGVVSTVGDLLSFANALLYFHHSCPGSVTTTCCYLSRKILSDIWTPLKNVPVPGTWGYAMGWFVKPNRALAGHAQFYVGHTGGAVGASSILLLKPSENESETGSSGIGVAVLTNLQECGGLGDLAIALAETFDRSLNVEGL